MAKNRTIPRMVGNIIPNSADTTPCAPPIIAATISPIGPKNIPNMAQRQPWSSLPPSFISFIAHLPSAPQISRIALHRRFHPRLRALLLLHRGKSSGFHKSHTDIIPQPATPPQQAGAARAALLFGIVVGFISPLLRQGGIALTSRGGASGNMGSQSRLMSTRTRYTCCCLDHAGEADLGHTSTRAHSLMIRTIRSASRRRDAREAALVRTRTHAHS